MRPLRARFAVILAALLGAQVPAPAGMQERPLLVVSASPAGEVGQVSDANEIRIVFSEPMVAIGSPVTERPTWLSIVPAIEANYYWSGTRTLIVTADPSRPLPYATRYSVRIDGAARSTSGRLLASPHTFSFTTPTVRLLSADWYRKTGRADSPAVIALRFNQPVRPDDVVSHARVRYAPHPWTAPSIDAAARELLSREDPAGLARFDDKVAATARVAASTATVAIQPAREWDEKRFPPAPALVVIETTAPPAPEAWLAVTLDDKLPSADGRETPAEQTTTLRLEPAFFVETLPCTAGCDPANTFGVGVRRGVRSEAVARALTVRDLTGGGAGRPVPAGQVPPEPSYRPADGYRSVSLPMAGYERQPAASTWALRIDASLEATDGQSLGYTWMGVIERAHERPYSGWTGQVWEAKNGPQVPFLARNTTEARLFLAPMAPADLMPRLLARQAGSTMVPDVAGAARRFSGRPDATEAHGIDLRGVLGAGGTGLVWGAVIPTAMLPGSSSDNTFGRPRASLLQVTNLGLSVKDSPQSTLVFVTRLDSAEPVAGASVSIVDKSNRAAWRGTTNANGVAIAPALSLRQTENPWQLSYLVTAEKDGDVAWVDSGWAADVEPSFFGLTYGLSESRGVLRGSIVTDRGVYALGDELRVKAVLRTDTPAGMQLLPEGTAVEVRVRDSRNGEVDKRTATVNRWSSIEWSWRVPADGSLGMYSVDISAPDAVPVPPNRARPQGVYGSFLVAAFRRPDFRVDATLTGDPAVLGQPLAAAMSAHFLFGAPLARQPVRWSVSRGPVRDVPAPIRERYPEDQFAFGYLPRPENQGALYLRLPERREQLTADGRLSAAVPTEAGADVAFRYQLESDVEGVSGQRIANRAVTTVHPASFYVGVTRPSFFVNAERGFTAEVVAANLAGTARANVPVTVSLVREQWRSERRPENPGFPVWVRTEIPSGEWTITTTAGRVSLPIPLRDGGCYTLRATAKDERGRPTRTEAIFYVLGRGLSAWRADGNRITLTPERVTWKPGETARVLVQSPWERATALVTTEREGIRSHRRIAITSTQDAIDVPITEADVPNVYVSVLLVKGRTSADATVDDSDPGKPGFRVGYTQLTVDDGSKRLNVAVKADKQEYRPRQEVAVSVTVADAQGRPRASEVTLWAMDYGLLSLTDYKTPDVARAIYARKQLQVQTQDNRAHLIGQRPMLVETQGQETRFGAGGGRGGGTGLSVPAPPPAQMLAESLSVQAATALVDTGAQSADLDVRRDFRPLAFWLGSIATGADGRATASVTLPDSLTTYRVMAVAGDLSSHFGAAESEIRATKPLTMLAAFPRFMGQGDRASFGAVVTNGTGRGGDAVVTIRSLDLPSLQFAGELTRTVRLAPGESVPVRFDATAAARGTARVRMTVTLGGETDAFEATLPVTAPARLESVAAYGDTIASATEKLTIPAGIVPGAGGLTVSLASTALVGLGESARYVDEYPYDCAEQKASRALALLLSADLGGAFALATIKPEETRAAGTRALNELYAYQCPDGGFSLWPGRCVTSSPYLTAYILNVMKIAASLQVVTDRNAIDRALGYLQNQLRQPPPEVQWWPAWGATQAYALKVLTEHGRNQAADVSRLYGMAARLPIFALSYLADALVASGDRGARYQDVVRRLSNALRVDADRAHVEEVDEASLQWLWNSNVRATAVVLGGIARRQAALEVRPGDPTLVAPLARWLLAARTSGRWGTTQENAVALEALVNYYRAFEAETPQMTATVALAGATVGSATFAGRSTTAQQVRIEMPDLVARVAGAVTRDLGISRTGTGRVHYTARLQYLVPESPAAVDRGLRLTRKYERVAPGGAAATPGPSPAATSPAGTSFASGDLVRVTITVDLPHEGRFLAFTDPLPAGFEPIDAQLKTTATDLGAQATTQSSAGNPRDWWRRGGFEHVEKHDDRLMAFATRLAAGRHELTYLARATTAGTFNVAGARGEAMYAPEIHGRSAAVVVQVK